MNRDEIMALISGLARSTGWYSSLYEEIMLMDEEDRDEWFTYLEEQDFKSDLDFIVFWEEGLRLNK